MKKNRSRQIFVALMAGVTFALGLAMAGMTQPQKVIGFLDPWHWDPSLLFVMAGAISVHAISYPFIKRRPSPLFDTKWHIPNRKDLTPRLIIGAALFGFGWGMGGFCPGPGLVSLPTGDSRALVFVITMALGMFIFKKTEPYLGLRE